MKMNPVSSVARMRVGQAGSAWRMVSIDGDGEGLHLALPRLFDFHPFAFDEVLWRQEQQVAHQRSRHAFDEGLDLRPDALQRGRRCEQGKKNLGAH